MNVLITGIHGFVGSNLVEYLKANNTLYGLDIISPAKDGVMQTFSWNDLDNLPSIDAIIHLAGKAHDTKNHAQAEEYFAINTELTKKIYDFFLQSDAKKFIFFSTAKAAADRVDTVLTEDVVPMPIGPYGESKIAAERYILANMQEDKDVYILRPCMIHGPGNKGNLNLLYSIVQKGIPWPLGSYDNLRTFSSIENVCYAVNGLLTRPIESGIYNMGDDDPVSTTELINIICSTIGKKSRIWHLPKWLMNNIAVLGTWLHLPLNSERLRKLTENYVASNQKIKEALGIINFPIAARAGLVKTIQSFVK